MEQSFEEIGYKGKLFYVKSIKIGEVTFIIRGNFLKCARPKDEEYNDIIDPIRFVETLRKIKSRPDLLTFKQRYPQIAPKFNFYKEFESIAVLLIHSYKEWICNQISKNSKRAIEKAKNNGVNVKIVEFDNTFVEGMVEIFSESPIRQKSPFWHYGKNHATIKQEFSRSLFREDVIGAFWEGKLIGFIFLANAGNYAIPTQILTKIAHRDKGVTNILLAKAVEICEEKKIPVIVYGRWKENTLTEFKRRNGFKKVDIPRYFIPLTLKGKIAIKLGLHRGLFNVLPEQIQSALLSIRLLIHNFRRQVSICSPFRSKHDH